MFKPKNQVKHNKLISKFTLNVIYLAYTLSFHATSLVRM